MSYTAGTKLSHTDTSCCATVLTDNNVMVTTGLGYGQMMKLVDWLILADGAPIQEEFLPLPKDGDADSASGATPYSVLCGAPISSPSTPVAAALLPLGSKLSLTMDANTYRTIPPVTQPSCNYTVLAIIYTGLEESNEDLAQDIEDLETRIWKYCAQRYLGIFILCGTVAPHFSKFGKFHCATDTCYVVKKDFIEHLCQNETTHVLIVGAAPTAAALEAKKHGLHTCVFRPATRYLDSVEKLTSAGVIVADSNPALNNFLNKVVASRPDCLCNTIYDAGTPAWCIYKSNLFLWKTVMRLRRALSAVTRAGFDGVWPPSNEKDPSRRYKGTWRCSEDEKNELAAAIDQASWAGIHTDNAIYIYSFIPPFEDN